MSGDKMHDELGWARSEIAENALDTYIFGTGKAHADRDCANKQQANKL